MSRFFRRLANNVFDEKDVEQRANELYDFIETAISRYGRSAGRLTALGYSNGANMAAAMVLLHPEIFSQAILIRPMQPLESPLLPDLNNKKILVLQGDRDTVIPPEGTERLVATLRRAGADTTRMAIDAGHEITSMDIEAITHWLAKQRACEPHCRDERTVELTA